MKPKFLISGLALLAACSGSLYLKTGASRTDVVAHRGYWTTEGSAENSLVSLRKADSIGAWGSECDVYLSADDVLMVNHDHRIIQNGDTLLMEGNTSTQLQQVVLKNGERMPTFAAYLEALKACKRTKLLIELKQADLSEERQKQFAAQAVAMVAEAGLQQRVEYITFIRTVGEEVIRLDPQANVAYLKGDLAPAELKALGYTGLDYHISVMREHEAWFAEARDLGLKVHVWTVNDEESMRYLIDQGADYITTDQPTVCQQVIKTYKAR